MSTRCQILFIAGPVRRLAYRHWDGYPAAVVHGQHVAYELTASANGIESIVERGILFAGNL